MPNHNTQLWKEGGRSGFPGYEVPVSYWTEGLIFDKDEFDVEK